MLIYLFCLIWFLCLVSVLIFNKNNKLINFFLFALIVIAFAFKNNNGGDLYAYEANYSFGEFSSNYEIGYECLKTICSFLKLPFAAFKIVIALISSFFLYLSCKRITKYYAVVLLSTSTFLIAFLGIALRYCLAFSISIFAITKLVTSKSKFKDLLYFVLLILLASFFHTFALICLVFALICFMKYKWANRIISFLCIVLAAFGVASFFLKTAIDLTWFSSKLSFLDKSKEVYFIGEIYIGSALLSSLFLISFFFQYFLFITKKKDIIVRRFFYINILSLVFIPLVVMNQNFHRLFFITLFLNYISYAYLLGNNVVDTKLVFSFLNNRFAIKTLAVIDLFLWAFYLNFYRLNGINIISFLMDNAF